MPNIRNSITGHSKTYFVDDYRIKVTAEKAFKTQITNA